MDENKQDSLKGSLIFPNKDELPGFRISNQVLKEFRSLNLSNGIIAIGKDPSIRAVAFDFDEGDVGLWPGYIKGFLYSDKKFIGKAHFVPEARIKEETLNGTYNFINKELHVKGIWYDSNNEKHAFYFFLNQTGKLVENPGGIKRDVAIKKSGGLKKTNRQINNKQTPKRKSKKSERKKTKKKKTSKKEIHISAIKVKRSEVEVKKKKRKTKPAKKVRKNKKHGKRSKWKKPPTRIFPGGLPRY
jgi:hypothetical protein